MRFCLPLLSLVLLSFASCIGGNHGPIGHPPASRDFLIKPGVSVGKIIIGENLDSVRQQMGQPDASDAAMGGRVIETWFSKHDSLSTNISLYAVDTSMNRTGQQWVKKIKVTDAAYRTQEGIGAGDSLINIARIFIVRPIDTFSYKNLLYTTFGTQRGMTFVIDPKGVCQSIIIYPRSDGDSSAYRPFY